MSNMEPTRSGPLASTTNTKSASLSTSNVPRRKPLTNESRDSSQQRPPFSPRASSLGIPTKLDSSVSSSGSPAYVGSSGLKQETYLSLPAIDSLGALEVIVAVDGNNSTSRRIQSQSPTVRSHTCVSKIKFTSLSLQEFIAKSETELNDAANVPEPKSSAPRDAFVEAPPMLETLRRSISNCDRLLESVQFSLANLQKDLGTVSLEIETLQGRSRGINEQLYRRRAVEGLLGSALEDVSIPPAIILKLSRDPVDQDWAAALAVLERRLHSSDLHSSSRGPRSQDSDLQMLLENLRNISVERIRDYFVRQIRALRSPKVNAQVLQQRTFLPYKELFMFLARYQPQLADDMMKAYSSTMRWYYLASFAGYKDALEKVGLLSVNKHDALGSEVSNTKGSQSTPQTTQRVSAPFLLGRRSSILSHESHNALPLYVIAEMKQAVYIETPFHTFSTAVAENASAEYTFLTSFLPSTMSFSTLSQAFTAIFEPVFHIAHSFTRYLSSDTIDCLGLLLCIRTMQQHAFTLQRRRCPVTEGWVNHTKMLLWPKFQGAMDAHVASLRRATASLSLGTKAALSLTLNRVDDGKGSIAPTPITQQFGQLLQGLLALSSTNEGALGHAEIPLMSSDAEPVGRSLERLRKEFQAFLLKASKRTIVGDHLGPLANEQREWIEEQILEAETA